MGTEDDNLTVLVSVNEIDRWRRFLVRYKFGTEETTGLTNIRIKDGS